MPSTNKVKTTKARVPRRKARPGFEVPAETEAPGAKAGWVYRADDAATEPAVKTESPVVASIVTEVKKTTVLAEEPTPAEARIAAANAAPSPPIARRKTAAKQESGLGMITSGALSVLTFGATMTVRTSLMAMKLVATPFRIASRLLTSN